MFNMYVWELYLKSGGSKSVEMFKNCFINGISEEYSDFISMMGYHNDYIKANTADGTKRYRAWGLGKDESPTTISGNDEKN